MSDTERDGITAMFACLNGLVWYFLARWFEAPHRVALIVGVVTGVICWVLLRWFQVRGEDDAPR